MLNSRFRTFGGGKRLRSFVVCNTPQPRFEPQRKRQQDDSLTLDHNEPHMYRYEIRSLSNVQDVTISIEHQHTINHHQHHPRHHEFFIRSFLLLSTSSPPPPPATIDHHHHHRMHTNNKKNAIDSNAFCYSCNDPTTIYT